MGLFAMSGLIARYEEAGYAELVELVVVLTCKSHDPANPTTGNLEIKTGFRHRPTRRLSFNLVYDRLFYLFFQRPVVYMGHV